MANRKDYVRKLLSYVTVGVIGTLIACCVLAGTLYVGIVWLWLASDRIDQRQAVLSGYQQIPAARQIDELLGVGDHFISGPENSAGASQWCTDVYFAGRYSLGMRVDVLVDRRTCTITSVLGEPKFYLHEFRKIEILPDGRASARYESKGQHEISADQWRAVVAANGDFSVIGIPLRYGSPIANFDRYIAALPHRRFGP